MNNVTSSLAIHLAELFGLPLEGMKKMVVTLEAKSVPTVDVEYFVLGERGTRLTSKVDEGEPSPETKKVTYRVTECVEPDPVTSLPTA